MTPRFLLCFALPLALLSFDCRSRHAFAMAECAPTDGAAVVLYLLDSPTDILPPERPHLKIEVWRSRDALAGHTFVIAETPAWGVVSRCASQSECENAIGGRVRFQHVDLNTTIAGDVDVEFSRGERVRSQFKAMWRLRRPPLLCG